MFKTVKGQFLSPVDNPFSNLGSFFQEMAQYEKSPLNTPGVTIIRQFPDFIKKGLMVFLLIKDRKINNGIIDMVPVFDIKGQQIHGHSSFGKVLRPCPVIRRFPEPGSFSWTYNRKVGRIHGSG